MRRGCLRALPAVVRHPACQRRPGDIAVQWRVTWSMPRPGHPAPLPVPPPQWSLTAGIAIVIVIVIVMLEWRWRDHPHHPRRDVAPSGGGAGRLPTAATAPEVPVLARTQSLPLDRLVVTELMMMNSTLVLLG